MKRKEILQLRKKLNVPLKPPQGFYSKNQGKKILRAILKLGLNKEEMANVINKSTIAAIENIYTRAGIKRPRPKAENLVWNKKMDQAMFDGFKESVNYSRGAERNKFKMELVRRINAARDSGLPEIKTWKAVSCHMDSMFESKRLSWGGDYLPNSKAKVDKAALKEKEIADFKSALAGQERLWHEANVLEISEEAWNRPGIRRGYSSRWDYKGPGYRSGIILQGCLKFIEEGCRFICVVGGLTNKNYIKKELQRRFKTVKPQFRDSVTEHFLNESAKELASMIPKILKPASVWADPSKPEFVRFYISTSPIYDGPYSQQYETTYGEEIARRLQTLRTDIRVQNEGSARLEVKDVDEIDWVISPVKHRLPSQYYSAAAEREIRDKSAQSDQLFPDRWIVGTQASAIHKTSGEKERPYITLPALCRLEATTVAENQEGITVVESLNDNCFVRFWNFKDLIHKERQFITGIKEGSSELHRKIVKVIKDHGAMTVGLLSDKLGVEREVIEREIKFLEEPKMSARKTWPGLFYNPKSQRYDFHLDWLQEKLRYHLPIEYSEDILLKFGCVHAGYTTTDYQHFVSVYPQIILDYKVKTLVGLGDFVAGLKHDLMHRGEIIGSLNETDHQIFAAELVSTVIFKPFKKRFEDALSKFTDTKPTAEELKSIVMDPLVLVDFIYIVGNHDAWPQSFGTTPLGTFRDKLTRILYREISALFSVHGLPAIDFYGVIDKKLIELPDFNPVCTLPSGLTFGARHPGMARADTTSLRAQKALEALGTQIVGIANFHVATTVRVWRPDLGQCVAVQASTQVIYTPFEGSKMKKLDFGPTLLRTLSHGKRVYMDETAYFNKPLLQKPIPKWTDVDQLKKSLNLLTI